MNRLDVAQYLCEVLQASPDELTHVDHRGDTPARRRLQRQPTASRCSSTWAA